MTSQGGIVVIELASGVKHHLHRALLTQHSDFFKRAFNGRWREAREGVVRLQDVENGACKYTLTLTPTLLMQVVNLFVDWLYSQNVCLLRELDGDSKDISMINAIVLGDRLLAPAFTDAMQRSVVFGFVYRVKAPSFAVITCAYNNLPADNPILKLLVDAHVLFYKESASEATTEACDIANALPYRFLLGIMHKYAQRKQSGKRDRLRESDYH